MATLIVLHRCDVWFNFLQSAGIKSLLQTYFNSEKKKPQEAQKAQRFVGFCFRGLTMAPDQTVSQILPKLCGLTQEFLRFTAGWKTWQCWKPPSPASRVSSETASPLCRKPRTGASAPLSTLGGATAGLRMSTLMLPGNTQSKKSSYLIVIVLSRNRTNLFHVQCVTNLHAVICSLCSHCLYRDRVKETIIEKFAGPYDCGEYSPSVQKTLYDTQVLVLDRIPEVSNRIEIVKLCWNLRSPQHWWCLKCIHA